ADHDSFKTSQIAIPDSLIASHRSMKNSLIGSQYTYTSTAAATNAATTNAIGLASIVAFNRANATLKLIMTFFTVFIIATVVANDAIPATTAVINGNHGSNALYTDLILSTISGIFSAIPFSTSSNFFPNSATISRMLGRLFFSIMSSILWIIAIVPRATAAFMLSKEPVHDAPASLAAPLIDSKFLVPFIIEIGRVHV